MKKIILILLVAVTIQSCVTTNDESIVVPENILDKVSDNTLVENKTLGFPVNYPTMKGYYDANPFGNITSNGRHLGADLNKPGNSDLGDTIYSIGYGEVVEAYDAFLAIKHRLKNNRYIISGYFHCKELLVEWFDVVRPGQPVAILGKKYTNVAHLHFEILTDTTKRAGFYGDLPYCVNPVQFINDYNK